MKVDVVYTWVDSDDPQWKYEYDLNNEADFEETKFKNNNELLYSLRSLEKHASSFIGNIYIVTNG